MARPPTGALQARGYEAHVKEEAARPGLAQGLPFTTPDGQPGRVA